MGLEPEGASRIENRVEDSDQQNHHEQWGKKDRENDRETIEKYCRCSDAVVTDLVKPECSSGLVDSVLFAISIGVNDIGGGGYKRCNSDANDYRE